MFLRVNHRKKDGKTHQYWNVVENRRLPNGRTVQRQLLYLGEINDSQHEAWRRTIEVMDGQERKQVALFPEDRAVGGDEVIKVRLSELTLEKPRQWGACWLANELWEQLKLGEFWAGHLGETRKGTNWSEILQTLVGYRLIDPGSEWKLHAKWLEENAMLDLLGMNYPAANTLYRCLDRLVKHKDELFQFLKGRWGELFGAKFDVLLYDLTSTYFEIDAPDDPQDKRRHGYSRDKRFDCPQVVLGLIVTPEGLPLSYEVFSGNTVDSRTLEGVLKKIETLYGKANRIWVMDRGVPTEESLAQMRANGASYLVGTPKGRLTRLEQEFLQQPWSQVRDGISVKRLEKDEDCYVLAQSDRRIDKERAMRRKKLKRYIARLKKLQQQKLTRDALVEKIGAAKQTAGNAARLIDLQVPETHQKDRAAFSFSLSRKRLRILRRHEGRYLLRTNISGGDPNDLWRFYIQLTEVEQAFKELKNDLAVRPIYHQLETRIEAHIFVAFLAYCLQVTLKNRLRGTAAGLTPRQVFDHFKAIQMVDVHLPTTDGREVILSRYTQPEPVHKLLLEQLRLTLPEQPPPKVTARQLKVIT